MCQSKGCYSYIVAGSKPWNRRVFDYDGRIMADVIIAPLRKDEGS